MSSYRIKPEYGATVLKSLGEFRDVNNQLVGYEHVGVFYDHGENVPESEISPVILKRYEEGDPFTLEVFEKNDDEPKLNELARAGVPFEDYDSLSVGEVVAALEVLPDSVGARIRQWEIEHQNRPEITEYSLGRREGTVQRVTGEVGSASVEATPGSTADIPTREVGESSVDLGADAAGRGGGATVPPNDQDTPEPQEPVEETEKDAESENGSDTGSRRGRRGSGS